MRFQLADQFARLLLDLEEGRLRMGGVPGIHFGQDVITELFEGSFLWHASLFVPFSLLFLPERGAIAHLSNLVHAWGVLPPTHQALPILPRFPLPGYLPHAKK